MSQSNPHFTNLQRSAYQFGALLKDLPSSLDSLDLTSIEQRQKLEAAERHAENYSEILLDGLESLGRVMWSAGENEEWPVAQNDVSRLGMLVSQLSIQLQFLDEFRTSANYELAQAGKKGARK